MPAAASIIPTRTIGEGRRGLKSTQQGGRDMEIKRIGDDHIVFLHDGIASARPMMLIAVGCVAVVALATLFGGSWLSLIVVLVVGGFLLSMLWRASARTAAVLDRERGALAITHTRGGKIVGEEDVPFAEISQVIVEPAAGGSGKAASQSLLLRPAVLASDRIVPLTYRAFESGRRPIEAAEAIRDFLRLPLDDLIEGSVAVLARNGDRVQPAVRLARLGLGLGRLEAAAMVARLRKDG
jgi:hypothetical protein